MIDCVCEPVSGSTIENARKLTARYDFQLFDSIIVAGALEANCSILYSEDMQHGLLVENKLEIVNPFL
jgi:predicted nucleic acid-binding protein